jgi:hypothetical protein
LPGDVARLLACTTKFRAQDWPNAPIKLIIPYATGGGNDRTARLLAKALEDQHKAPMSNNLFCNRLFTYKLSLLNDNHLPCRSEGSQPGGDFEHLHLFIPLVWCGFWSVHLHTSAHLQ